MTRDGLATLRVSRAQSAREQKAVYAEQITGKHAASCRHWLDQNVRWIITPVEKQAIQRFRSDQEHDLFTRQFWELCNPPPYAWLPSGSSFKSTPSQCLRMSRNVYFRKRLALVFETVQQSLLKRSGHSVERTCFKVLRSQSRRWFASRQIQFNPKSKCKSMYCYTLLCKSQT